ncbi:SPOR domain-containing protein [Desulfovibrio inopinatus]|uniref:SPOR domain-containing protein n=1 Tax=Desulfovibrio inopinatus TaxID=102109 RepID=UPI000403F770|nr:SPOR domain-containing protein [Desulfovibrio inopinatus]
MKTISVFHRIPLLFLLATVIFIAGCADWNNGFEEEILGRAPTPVDSPAPVRRASADTAKPALEASPAQGTPPELPSNSLMESGLTEKTINEATIEPMPVQTAPTPAQGQAIPLPVPPRPSAPVAPAPMQENAPIQVSEPAPVDSPREEPAVASPVVEPAPDTDVQRFRSIYQVSAFVHEDNAKSLRDMLSDRGHNATIEPSDVNGKTYYRVLVTLEGTTPEMLSELSEIGVTTPKLVTQTPLP